MVNSVCLLLISDDENDDDDGSYGSQGSSFCLSLSPFLSPFALLLFVSLSFSLSSKRGSNVGEHSTGVRGDHGNLKLSNNLSVGVSMVTCPCCDCLNPEQAALPMARR